jgi:hypothetical protein
MRCRKAGRLQEGRQAARLLARRTAKAPTVVHFAHQSNAVDGATS